ncbi:TmcC family electron transfer complex membrane anchor subunit [Desulfosarcina sp.]|uniref:TmcC family electron transfer complex membrane anchor subunit n=1 Tax=Desulfosarcina sp. TaxID=2027861 RepID=UPI003970D92E
MHTFYNFVSGPLAWVAFILFFGGSIYRIASLLKLVADKEKFIFSYMSWRYSLRSIIHWITPFATVNWRRQPVLTVVTFAFHLCLLVTPIFLLSHVVLWDEAFGISWWTLPDAVADAMTIIVILGTVYFLVRRLTQAEVKFVTSPSDFVILAIVAAPFITGLIAYHQWFAYPLMMSLHVLAGNIMLAAIPFTRLSHMLFSPFTRAYMGSEFGKVRHARDW